MSAATKKKRDPPRPTNRKASAKGISAIDNTPGCDREYFVGIGEEPSNEDSENAPK